MARELFVEPDSVTLPLFDDGVYWIIVKKQLNSGESKQFAAAGIKRLSRGPNGIDPGYDVDMENAAFIKVAVYLQDWNLSKNGKVVPIDTPKAKVDALRATHPDIMAEVERVIGIHVLEMQEKKQTTGSLEPAPT